MDYGCLDVLDLFDYDIKGSLVPSVSRSQLSISILTYKDSPFSKSIDAVEMKGSKERVRQIEVVACTTHDFIGCTLGKAS